MTPLKKIQLESFLDQPAKEPFFLKLIITSTTKFGRALLLFHPEPKLNELTTGQIYSDKVERDRTPRQIIIKNLGEIKKVSKLNLLAVKTSGTDRDETGKEILKIAVLIKVPYFPTVGKRFRSLHNAYMSWVGLESLEKKLKPEKSKERFLN